MGSISAYTETNQCRIDVSIKEDFRKITPENQLPEEITRIGIKPTHMNHEKFQSVSIYIYPDGKIEARVWGYFGEPVIHELTPSVEKPKINRYPKWDRYPKY